ncbi:hypothetical protein HUB98_22760 [Paenibacillus barcinonensis]|uniref:Uncharacterized protein n=1 Tax=Paenibacillus barcinonensis TaxID=198119 RepID=A0ABX6Q9U3_PAEBA|nr:hypothetical protein [Paenibacillus barcinonensis]QKS58762.1 hypothetical protein HUB98_22760 [Paenibacillus barcinonensis]
MKKSEDKESTKALPPANVSSAPSGVSPAHAQEELTEPSDGQHPKQSSQPKGSKPDVSQRAKKSRAADELGHKQ